MRVRASSILDVRKISQSVLRESMKSQKEINDLNQSSGAESIIKINRRINMRSVHVPEPVWAVASGLLQPQP